MKRTSPLLAATLLVLGLGAAARAQLAKPQETPAGAEQITQFIDVMEKYLYVVDHLTRMSENPTAVGVAAALQANDMLKSRPQEAIEYFNKLLPDVKNEAVKRAIRLQLADLYKNSNQNDKALDQLRELMAAPAGPPRPRPGSEPPPPAR
jgi:thioredoxin-like negative regulator of GroEL